MPNTHHAQPRLVRLLLICAVLAIGSSQAEAQFNPPRIVFKIYPPPPHKGTEPDSVLREVRFYIDRGLETSINRDDVLNVYREKRLSRQVPRPLRMLIGTMVITDSQQGSSVGRFEPNVTAIAHPLIRFKIPMKGDIVVPRLVIDSSVLFGPGSNQLANQAQQEFDKVAIFVQNFSPSKLIIEGHTDSDGDAASNQLLSKARAKSVKDYLVKTYNFITPAMIDAVGYGAKRPIVPNDTPENKLLNRRIEVLVWE